ncbi:MAG: asparagine synthase (glutamine-hydrolyzing) [Haloplanus sp.]
MCGIAGMLGTADTRRLGRMLSSIVHRGPDDEGRFVDEGDGVAMGARRLSIVDLSNGSQPMSNEDGTVTVAFNGEIYNHEALRAELETEGHCFRTNCDTEVLVHLWEEDGVDMPTRLEGMFAFSIWDSDAETLFLCRDRLGIKPLFVHRGVDELVWGSEVAAILAAGVDASVDPRSLYRYFSFRYTPQPDTLLDSVEKLPPGHSLTVRDGEAVRRQYWRLDQRPTTGSLDDVASRVRDRLEASVRKRLMGDVPVGAFLSGGLDSSAVVGLMSQVVDDVRTYSIGFDDESVDESGAAQFVADEFGTDHTEVRVDLSSMEAFGDVIRRYGEPLADPATLPTLLLAERASRDLKVVLTGEGADELFGGYGRYRRVSNHQPVVERVPGPLLDAVGTVGAHAGRYGKYFRYLSSLGDEGTAVVEDARWYEDPPETYLDGVPVDDFEDIKAAIDDRDDQLKRMEAFDVRYRLPDHLLYKVDHTTMAASIEARVPYLDHGIVELMAGVPKRTKLDAGAYKPVLRRAVDDVVPDRVLDRSKHGFTVPVGEWFKEGHEVIEAWLTEENLARTPHLDAGTVLDMWERHRRERREYRMPLWKCLNYVAWYHTHLLDR